MNNTLHAWLHIEICSKLLSQRLVGLHEIEKIKFASKRLYKEKLVGAKDLYFYSYFFLVLGSDYQVISIVNYLHQS